MKFIKKALTFAALGLLALAGAGLVLYALGLRIELDGGASPHLRFLESERARLETLERHREAQRAQPPRPGHAPAAVPAANTGAAAGAPPPAPVPADPPGVTSSAERADRPAELMPAVYWTAFRGPLRDGHYRERPIRVDWPSSGLPTAWKQPIGGGYASFAVARGRAFTIEQRGEREVVAAYEVATGRELWTVAWTAAFRELMGGDGPRATPTWADGFVHALGAQGELRVLDEANGKGVWRTNILEDAGAENLQWGMAGSPLVTETFVIVAPGGKTGRSVVAYDRRTGARAWSALDDQAGYASPMLATLAGVPQILVFMASRLVALVPETGELLWQFPWKTQFDINAAQPLVIGDNRVFVSSGSGTGGAVIEIVRSGSGLEPREVWRNIRMKNQFTSSVLHEGHIYGLDEAILACLDAATGEVKWKGGRYGYGQVVLASGHLVVTAEDGSLALVRATPERHHEIARFPVLEGKTWNHPALSDGYLLVRNATEMAAFDLRPR